MAINEAADPPASKSDRTVALAGIGATLVAGLTGVIFGYLAARSDRSTQASIAHAARVYSRRADAYLAAVGVFEAVDRALGDLGLGHLTYPVSGRRPGSVDARRYAYIRATNNLDSQTLDARLLTFGSEHAFDIFQRVREANDQVAKYLFRGRLTYWLRRYQREHDTFLQVMHAELG